MRSGHRSVIGCICLIGTILSAPGFSSGAGPVAQVKAEQSYVEKVAFTMSTVARIKTYGTGAGDAADAAMQEIHRVDVVFDRFDASSDIGKINAAIGDWVVVHQETLNIMSAALDWAKKTDGAFDPTVAPLIDLWGFVEGGDTPGNTGPTPIIGRKPPELRAIEKALTKVDFTGVNIDSKGGRLRLEREGAQLDLGGMIKGYAADRAAAVLRSRGVENGLVDLGGDLYVMGTRTDGSRWRIGVTHPRIPGQFIAIVSVRDKAIVTSGDYERYFEYDGVRYTHLLNPHTGYPARGLISVTVVAPRGMTADTLATACFALGKDRAVAFLEQLPGVDAILIDEALDVFVTPGLREYTELRN